LAPLVRTIVIVGGGFSGTMVAANLLRQAPSGPTRIILIERANEIGRGVAYAQRRHPYLLNVPASRMSATPKAVNEFIEFAQRRVPHVTAEDFLPRALYGDYLQEVLLAAELSAPRNVKLDKWQGNVTNVRRLERHMPLQVELADGRRVTSDDVVLALGNPTPAPLSAAKDIESHPGYVADPYTADLTFSPQESVLLIGTGLTATDFINVASADPTRTPALHMLSRHGLIPPRQTAFRPDAFKGDGDALLLAASTSLTKLTSSVRLLAREAEKCGGDWREAVTFVRHMAPTIWQRLNQRDRARFLRHLRAQWDAHRHRLPPEALSRIDNLKGRSRLHVHAGRIQRMRILGERIEVTWLPRGTAKSQTQYFDRVINCTGPDYAIERSRDPLWRTLLQNGLCVPDAQKLGLRTGPHGAVIDADGWPGPHLFYIGPMLRADHLEATAVGELRTHASALATLLATGRH
jgi:uncharacterized NAD(P)/FAD-binding protein YdhS